jgi:hypothetical protein
MSSGSVGRAAGIADPAHDLGITMVEQNRGAGVHAGDARRLLLAELEIEDVEVSAIRWARTDFGITTTSRWMSQRSTTWATDLPWASPISVSTGIAHWDRTTGPTDERRTNDQEGLTAFWRSGL